MQAVTVKAEALHCPKSSSAVENGKAELQKQREEGGAAAPIGR